MHRKNQIDCSWASGVNRFKNLRLVLVLVLVSVSVSVGAVFLLCVPVCLQYPLHNATPSLVRRALNHCCCVLV